MNDPISICELKGDSRTCRGVRLFDGRLEYLGLESVPHYLNTPSGHCNTALRPYFVHGNISDSIGFIARVGQEQEITSIEGWLHRPTKGEHRQDAAKSALRTQSLRTDATKLRHDPPEDDHNRVFGIANEAKTFPHHKSRRHYIRKVQCL